jgi:hypothetical protein
MTAHIDGLNAATHDPDIRKSSRSSARDNNKLSLIGSLAYQSTIDDSKDLVLTLHWNWILNCRVYDGVIMHSYQWLSARFSIYIQATQYINHYIYILRLYESAVRHCALVDDNGILYDAWYTASNFDLHRFMSPVVNLIWLCLRHKIPTSSSDQWHRMMMIKYVAVTDYSVHLYYIYKLNIASNVLVSVHLSYVITQLRT